jgi:hypothetical protein
MSDTPNYPSGQPTRRAALAAIAAGGLAVAAASLATSPPASAQPAEPLIGSWMSTYHRSTGEVLAGLVTFHDNGTVINSTSDHLTGGTSHGSWTSLGSGQYAYSVLRLDVDAEGNYSGIRTVDADVSIDPTSDNWTSVSQTNFYDIDGNLLRTLTTMGAASRIPVVRRQTRSSTFPLGN